MYILGIETSCDETAFAVLQVNNTEVTVLASQVSSQVKVHAQYGGVVPEVAAREHMQVALPLLDATLVAAGVTIGQIDLIAATQGPGLASALMVGFELGKSLALGRNISFVPVNHMAGHVWSWLLGDIGQVTDLGAVRFPYLALLVSGGHTELVKVMDWCEYELLGQTRDDAVGEAFDKVAKILGFGYPGGPQISKHAVGANESAYAFPRPMLDSDDFDFSFAGLKTAVLYKTKKQEELSTAVVDDIAASFQAAAIEVLVKKTSKATVMLQPEQVVVAGGVSANTSLRDAMTNALDCPVSLPALQYTGDNAAMIALAGAIAFKYSGENFSIQQHLSNRINPNLRLAA